MNYRQEYKFVYVSDNKPYHGSALLFSDKEAIDYFQALEQNGAVKVKKVTNPHGTSIWNKTYARRKSPFHFG